jgi:hypothetical protein
MLCFGADEGVWQESRFVFVLSAIVFRRTSADLKSVGAEVGAVEISREGLSVLVLKIDGFAWIREPLGLTSCFEEPGARGQEVGVDGETLRGRRFADDDVESVCEVVPKQSAQSKINSQ